MTRATRSYVGPPAALAAVVVCLGLVLGFVERAGLSVSSCLPLDSGAGWMALRLALVRHAENCPVGSYAPGGTSEQILTVLASIALPALVGYLVGGVVGALALHAVGRAVRSVRSVLTRGLTLPAPVVPVPVGHAPSVWPVACEPVSPPLTSSITRRGPPAPSAA